jgi:hypothetical protein
MVFLFLRLRLTPRYCLTGAATPPAIVFPLAMRQGLSLFAGSPRHGIGHRDGLAVGLRLAELRLGLGEGLAVMKLGNVGGDGLFAAAGF